MRSTLSALGFTLLSGACLLAGTARAADALHLSSVSQVRVTQRGALPGFPEQDQFCRFTLNAAQARAELARAQFIDPAQRQDEFPWVPCYVRGTALIEGQPAEWTIEAGGLALVSYADGGELWLGNEEWRGLSGEEP